jgi:hypothetical protein
MSITPRALRALATGTLFATACVHLPGAGGGGASFRAPSPDPRVGLRAGLYDAAEATWNMRVLSRTRPPKSFEGITNSDLAFTGKYAIQGNYNGWQIWDISNPAAPSLATAYVFPASQSDVSVYGKLLFISGEGLTGRLDCGAQGVKEAVSRDRLRGLRIFDISDIQHPRNVGNVQTCRGSHTHSLLADPKDADNVYIYISGSAGVRSAEELPGCVNASPDKDPNSALFRIEVIKVPLAHPEQAAIVNSPRIFNDLVEVRSHGLAPDDKADIEAARARGEFIVELLGQTMVMPQQFTRPLLDSIVKGRGGQGFAAATAADSNALRPALAGILMKRFGIQPPSASSGPRPGPTQCHDITLYPAIGRAGGACEGYGMLLDISNPTDPKRLTAVADSNFAYWHSATFNNDGTTILFSDEWGGGGGPKCRASDPKEWGADAIFKIVNGQMVFQSYYKLPAAQTKFENCVAHNGSLIPVPGRDIMVQSWYQGGVSVFEFTDPARPREIAFFDRGPVDSTRMGSGGTWSVYWYNGVIVSSEISRGLDILELTPSAVLTQNEIAAAKTVHFDYLNTQGQPKFTWPASFALARAYTDQLARSKGLSGRRLAAVRTALDEAESATAAARASTLGALASQLSTDAAGSNSGAKVQQLAAVVRELAR